MQPRLLTHERRRSPVTDLETREGTIEWSALDRRAVDTIRGLAADAVQKVNEEHEGWSSDEDEETSKAWLSLSVYSFAAQGQVLYQLSLLVQTKTTKP